MPLPRARQVLRRKINAFFISGAPLGWLLIPEQQAVEIWRVSNGPVLPLNASSLLMPALWIPCCLACIWTCLNSGRLQGSGPFQVASIRSALRPEGCTLFRVSSAGCGEPVEINAASLTWT